MNTLRKMACLTLSTAATLVSSSALAEYNYHEIHGYQQELEECVAMIRPILGLQDGEMVQYEVKEIDLQGPWYRFEIATTIKDTFGQTQVDGFSVGCKSNRWIESASLIDRRNSLEIDQLIVSRTAGTAAPAVLAINVTSR